ncbi:MAG TPA: Gmad2 immunoglobulin-like domain-containing protein [Candidatus Paceibacterota bacterium]
MKTFFILILIILLGSAFLSAKSLIKPEKQEPIKQEPTEDTPPSDIQAHIDSKKDLIVLESPKPLEMISSPITLTGKARGTWFFEASFPVTVVDWDGKIIGEGHADAVLDPNDPNSTWMTEDFVPFKAEVTFDLPENVGEFSNKGAIILRKANASDLPENDDALEVPILFWEQG